MHRLLAAAWLAFCGAALGADTTADATAKFLAGLPVNGTSLESHGADPAWTRHAADMNRAWAELEKNQLSKIREWAPQNLGDFYAADGPMFYMFSGPDSLYAYAFFPNASTYILCGAEPVGAIPDIEKMPTTVLSAALTNLRKTLESSLSWSFFITKHMKVDLNQAQLSGTLPALYVFLARMGCTIDSVAPVALDHSGNFVTEGKGNTPGVRITFTGANQREQTLYYFAGDLADWSVKSNPGLLEFCRQQGQGLCLLKAASYLMHGRNFTEVRDFLLSNSRVIVQDDSGIPFRFFDPAKWSLRYFGQYLGPIGTFKEYPQPELMKAYAGNAHEALPFAFGYQWHPGRSSLLVATPK